MKADRLATDVRPWNTATGRRLIAKGFFYQAGDNDSHYFGHCDGRTATHNLRTGKVAIKGTGRRVCPIRRTR